MSEWITDRRPTAQDADDSGYVWVTTAHGKVLRQLWSHIGDRPWMPLTPPEPYVKPKRFRASWDVAYGWWRIERNGQWFESLMWLKEHNDQHREAAERIAAIYEEVMP